MAATHALTTIMAAATSNSASSSTSGTAADLTACYGGLMTIKITNGGTGPTVAASMYVYTSGDNTNFKLFTKVTSDTVASSVNEWPVDIPPGTMYVNTTLKDNTGQAVTGEAFIQKLTGI